ncbi:hypothetical protein ACH5RR_002421 [Cinchona calisaya]|uniref:Uncharacterized protein n=1 Tax=Cinchona calisaya TaxID=153742 RepID=A0ABD3B672_9GENT
MLHRRSRAAYFFEVFTLNPLPYPVLQILGVVIIFLGLQSYVSYDSMVESTEGSMGLIKLAVPLVLIFIVSLLSNVDRPERFFWSTSPWDRHRNTRYRYTEGSSPWGVAALILLLLVLMQFQSTFLDSWFI